MVPFVFMRLCDYGAQQFSFHLMVAADLVNMVSLFFSDYTCRSFLLSDRHGYRQKVNRMAFGYFDKVLRVQA